MSTYSDSRYCSVNTSGGEDPECMVGTGQDYVTIGFESSFGTPTNINLVCNNEPCIPAECGDGFCSEGFETPLLSTGGTETSCEVDCGLVCGNVVDETIEYVANGDSVEYTVEL